MDISKENKRVRVRFKFLLGEFLVGSWHPTVISISCDADTSWKESLSIHQTVQAYPTDHILLKGSQPLNHQVGIQRVEGRISYVQRIETTYFVAIQGTYDDYLSRRSAKSRYNIKRTIKRLQDRNTGPILSIFTTAADMGTFHKLACEISRHTYQTKLLDAGLPDTPAFLKRMEEIAQRGEARAYLLFDKGHAIAFAWCTSRGTRMTYNVIGYLPNAANHSPGTALLALIIEDLHKVSEFTVLDFGVGHSFYKEAFATDKMEHVDIFLFRASAKSWILIHLHYLTNKLSEMIGNWLEHHGIKVKVKGIFRKLRVASNR